MRNRLFILFFCLTAIGNTIPFTAIASSDPIVDSLSIALISQSGTEQLKTYIALIASLRNTDPARGIDLAREGIAKADQQEEELLKAKILNEEGVCYRKLRLYDKALSIHFEVLSVFERFKDSMGIAFTYANIGNVYNLTSELDDALDYHKRALSIKEYLHNNTQIAYSHNAIGMVLIQQNKPEQALKYFESAVQLHIQNNDQIEEANIYGNLGNAMTSLGRYDEAIKYLTKAEYLYKKITPSVFGLATTYNRLADVYYRKGDLKNAINFLKLSENLSVTYNNPNLLFANYALQSKVLEAGKQFAEALIYHQKAFNEKDSITNLQRFYELQEIKVRYETSKIDTDNVILRLKIKEQDLRIRSYIILLIGITFVLFSFFAIWRYAKNKKMSKHLGEVNQSLEKRVEERTRELKNQIHAREEAINSLRKSEEKFKTIAETSPLGITVSNASGQIIFANIRLSELTGLTKQQFLEDTWISQVMVEDREQVIEKWKSGHNELHQISDFIFRMVWLGKINWFHLKAAPIVNDQEFLGMVALIENITAQKEFEQQLIRSKNKAEESDRLKSAFLANMSHEIRTPMNAILGFSDLLSSNEYDESEKIEFINMIKSSGKLLLNLINDIIDISKIEAGELKIQKSLFQLDTILDDTYNTFKQQLEQSGKKNVQLILNHREELNQVKITTDKLRLQQILTNLLSNALKFTNAGEVEFGALLIDDQFEFYVRDSGIGIPESKLEVIFERFRQADDSHTRLYGGTGLGLAITRNLTELLGGHIWAESVQNRGTVFYFTLPANDIVKNIDNKFAGLHNSIDFSGKTVLVAEDVDTNMRLIVSMLKKLNVKILQAQNGLIAVDMAVKNQIDFILLDIQMPELDGIETMRKLRSMGLKTPIIAITGFSLSEQEHEFIEMGFDAMISKPFSIEKLVLKFRKLLKN
jgi:PAS domain S-box-containing protein